MPPSPIWDGLPPGTYETYLTLLLGPIPTWKVDASITTLGWTTYMMPFSKLPPAKWNYVFAYNSASRIDRDKILRSDGVKSCHLESCHLPQLHGQVSMAPETTGVAINHSLSRYSSHSEQISAGGCDELSLVLRCLCSKVCAERGVISIAR